MPRNATNNFIALLAAGNLYPALLFSIGFASGPVYVTSSFQDLFFQGNTYSALRFPLEVSTIEDGASVQARGVTVTLSGFDPLLLPLALNEFQVGLPASIYLGLFDAAGQFQISESVVAWSGKTDQSTINADSTTASIGINLESVLLDMNVPVPYRYTNQDQQLFFPGDRGFDWVNSIQSVPLYWNQNTNTDGNP